MICSIRGIRLATCNSAAILYTHIHAHTHTHDEVIVIENPFRRNFDIVADSLSCLLSDVPACAISQRDELLSQNKILVRRFGEKPPVQHKTIKE